MKREPVHDRLDRTLGVLASRPSWTARELAEALGVSVRTVRRDLLRLSARGVLVESTTGRGGGIRVPPRSGLGRMPLDRHEAIDLVLALALAETLRSPMLFGTVKRLRQKIAAAFPPEERARLSALRRRIVVGPTSANITASWQPPRPAVLRPIHEAFFDQRLLELDYVTDGARTRRTVEPHYLVLSWPAWYLLVFDHLRQANRVLRIDRIEATRLADGNFRLRPADEMVPALGPRFAAL